VKNNSDEHKLSPYFDGLSQISNELSLDNIQDLSTKTNNSGDTGHTGDKT
jgi:hypothetical protein